MGRIFSVILLLLLSVNVFGQTLYEWNHTTEGYVSLDPSPTKGGQVFTIGNTGTNQSFVVDSIAFYIHNAVNGVFTFELFSLSGGYPTGSALSSKTVYSLTVGYNYIDMPSEILYSSTSYAIILTSSLNVNFDLNFSEYSGGSAIFYDAGTWSDRGYSSTDLLFEIYGHRNPTITTHPVSQTKCVGQSVTFTVGSDAVSPTYQWKKNGSNISGQTSSSYTISSVASSDAANYTCTVTESALGVSTTSNAATLTVPVTAYTSDASIGGNYCVSSSPTFYITVVGESVTYQWYKDGNPISGQTNSSYTLTNITSGDAGLYTCTYTATCGSGSSFGTLTVLTVPAITEHPQSQTVCYEDNITLDVTASGTSLTYQWRKDAVDISGANSSSYTITGVDGGDQGNYSVYISNACGSTTSNDAALTVGALVSNSKLRNPDIHYSFDDTYIDSSLNVNDLVAYDNATFSSSVKAVGSHSGYVDGMNDLFKTPTINLADTVTISFWFRIITNISDTRTIFGSSDSTDLSDNFNIKAVASNDIKIYTGSASAYPNINIVPGQWHHFMVSIIKKTSNSVARVWFDGLRSAFILNDSTLNLDWQTTGRWNLGVDNYINQDIKMYIDEFLVFNKLIPNEAQADSLYDLSYKNTFVPCSPTEPEIQIGRKKILLADKPRNIILNNLNRDLGISDSIITNYTLIDLAHDQNFISYSGAEVNDYIGTIRPNGNWDTISSFSYTILQDTSELFTLVENNIAFKSVTGLQKSKTYTIQYKISDGDYYDYAYASIYIADADSCVLIAPDGSGDYTSWSPVDNAFTSGYYYLQKRGSTINTTYEITINTSNVTIGAYGEGAYPIVNYTPTATTRTFSSTNHEGLLMRDIEVRNYTYDALQVVNFDNVSGQYTTIDNCIFTRQRFIGFHRGKNLRVYNCQIHDIMCDGMLIGGVDNIEISNNFIYDINKYYNYNGVAMSGSTPAYWGDGIQIEPFAASDGYTGYLTNDDAWIHHNYINKNDTNKQIIAYGSYMGTGKLTCEHNRLYGNPDASVLTKGFFLSTGDDDNRQDTIIWRYNIMEDVSTAFQYDGARHTELSYNVFRNANNFFNFTGLQDSCIVLNNTFYNIKKGDVFSDPYSGVHIRARNNIFYLPVTTVDIDNTAKGSFSSDNNLYYPNATGRDVTLGGNDIEGDPLFDSNLKLLVGSPCINTGIDLEFDTDLFGNSIVGLPDIGAYEYEE